MSEQELKKFFSKIATDEHLQKRLFVTKELTDVASIAKEEGYQVNAADILRAQAGRVLMMEVQEQEDVAAGKKAKSGAQWGRTGKGYLDNAGYWLNELIKWGCFGPASEPKLEAFLAKVHQDRELQAELLLAKTYMDVASVATKHGYEMSGVTLLKYQAIQILKLSNEKAEIVARGEQ